MVPKIYIFKIRSLLLLAALESSQLSNNVSANGPKIIIIGAGSSGIAAATKLLENGFTNLIVLEAENRIGGRVYSVEFGDGYVDMGGQWVHGEEGNVVYQMVKNMDLLSSSFNNYKDFTYFMSNGSVPNKNLTDVLHKIGSEVWADEESASKFSGSFGDYFTQTYKQEVIDQFGDNKEVHVLADMIKDWYQKFFSGLEAQPSWYNASTTGVYLYEDCKGDPYLNWGKRGYKTILDVMMKKVPNKTRQLPIDDKIFLNKVVTKIIWDDLLFNGVTVACSDSSVYFADHVIVTIPLGVLKNMYITAFQPELPSYKQNAIEGLSVGTVNKIILRFAKKWWPDNLKGFSLIWTENDAINLTNEFPYGPVQNGRSWLEDVYGFYVVDDNPRILLAWVTGEMAAEVENISDGVAVAGCMFLLRKFVGNKYEILEPEAVVRSYWYTNPHFRGSYSSSTIETDNRNTSAGELAIPLGDEDKETVLFAGEATSSVHFSTVHGAIESGYREANRIINFYKSK